MKHPGPVPARNRPRQPGRRIFRRQRRGHHGFYPRQKWSQPPTTPAPSPEPTPGPAPDPGKCCIFNRIGFFAFCTQEDPTCFQIDSRGDEKFAFDIAPDQRTLVYHDASQIGFADITDPYCPAATGLSTSVWGPNDVAVKDDLFALAGRRDQLIVMNITSQTSVRTFNLGARVSDITISPDRTIAAIATQGSYMVQVNISDSDPVAWTTQVISDITNITFDGGKVEIRADNIAVMTLRSNSVIILNLTDATILDRFSAGEVNLTGIDTIPDNPYYLHSPTRACFC